jgi:flagellar motor switch protein FliN/FliY
VFALISAGTAAGWFAIRVRGSAIVKGGATEPTSNAKLGRIHNVEMGLTVAIGHTRMSVRDVLNLEPGGVIELDRSAGAPADVLLNGRLIAHGEVVVVDSDYAVRITKILDVAEGLV